MTGLQTHGQRRRPELQGTCELLSRTEGIQSSGHNDYGCDLLTVFGGSSANSGSEETQDRAIDMMLAVQSTASWGEQRKANVG